MTLRPLLLGAVAATLAGVVAWDYWPAGQVAAPPAAVAVKATPAQVVTLNPLSQRNEADFAALFERPLFDPTRRKPNLAQPPVPVPAVAIAPDPVAEVPSGPAQPVLMGTVTSPWPGGAYLGDDQGGPVVFLRPGQTAQGLHLEEVHPDSALFKGPQGEVTLTLQKAPPLSPGVTGPNGLPADGGVPQGVDPAATDPAADPAPADPAAADPAAADPAPADPALNDPAMPDPGVPDPDLASETGAGSGAGSGVITAPVPQANAPSMMPAAP